MNVPYSSREAFTSLSSGVWMGFNEASQMCVCGRCACMSMHLPSSNENN